MKPMKVTMIVPRLPPTIDGLGDYSLTLARKLRDNSGIISEFIVCDPDWKGASEVEGFQVQRVSVRSKFALLKLLSEKKTVLLHYVGYGYARRGCPFWLVNALNTWKKNSDQKLIGMFHELYAFGPIWTSQFWTSPLQRLIAKKLVHLSDKCLTSKIKYAEIITSLSSGKHQNVEALPVFSNVGEPERNLPLSKRQRRMVIFGSRGPRERVYSNSFTALERVCRELKITEILDVGNPISFELPMVNGISINAIGVLSHIEISKLLSESMVGFFNYPTEYLSKSGIFAAYCAHGLLPIGTSISNQGVDQVEENIHYWLGDKVNNMNLDDGQIIATNAEVWYQGHNSDIQSMIFARYLLA